MHIFFSGIGGTAIGPLAMIAKQAGYDVSGSDKQSSQYIEYLRSHGITDIHIGQTQEQIAAVHQVKPIDWLVYSSAVAIENPDAPELKFCEENSIKTSKRDELLNHIITDKGLKLIAISGTHGKTTTTAMAIWLFKQLNIPVSYSVGAKISFGEMGEFDPRAEYFIYEADEFDRNFLAFNSAISIIPGIAYDHPDIYPTQDSYFKAFDQFIEQSTQTFMYFDDFDVLSVAQDKVKLVEHGDYQINDIKLTGAHNRDNAWLVIQALHVISGVKVKDLVPIMSKFPGVSRRFEKIVENVYSDYAHTPEKIRGALQMAHEVAGGNVVVVYEGLHNTRQHFIKDKLATLFDGVKKLYIVPSYRAREDESLEDLTPEKLVALVTSPSDAVPAALNDDLKDTIKTHAASGDLVLCLTAGGGGSLDEWLRHNFHTSQPAD